jgi:tRNA threonylcarbamoyl adenosine modification protein (Sua5/YciO/YrdC/YwlC family)
MSQLLQIHPDNPQPRLVRIAADAVRDGGVIVYPTDSCYALGCRIENKGAAERIRHIRRLDERHNLTLICRDLSEIASYAKVGNQHYRMLKALTPGPYTFILKATKLVPRRLQHPRRKTIGIRVPDNAIVRALLDELGEPLMSSSLVLPGEELPLTDPYEMEALVGGQVELVIDGGYCGFETTTVIDMVEDVPSVIREGLGDVSALQG